MDQVLLNKLLLTNGLISVLWKLNQSCQLSCIHYMDFMPSAQKETKRLCTKSKVHWLFSITTWKSITSWLETKLQSLISILPQWCYHFSTSSSKKNSERASQMLQDGSKHYSAKNNSKKFMELLDFASKNSHNKELAKPKPPKNKKKKKLKKPNKPNNNQKKKRKNLKKKKKMSVKKRKKIH